MSSSTSSSAEPALPVRQHLGGKHRDIGAADIFYLADALIGDALDVAGHGFALKLSENKQACTLLRNSAS